MSDNPEHRVLNGLLKAGLALADAQDVLRRDVIVRAPAKRITDNDLGPALWALIAVLERQFAGRIFVPSFRSGASLAPFGPRIVADEIERLPSAVQIGMGNHQPDAVYGDAGSEVLTVSPEEWVDGRASLITGFALAAYLGFAALASAAGIPLHKRQYIRRSLSLPPLGGACPPAELTIIGLGQLGQSYLAFIYFLGQQIGWRPKLFLIDKDHFAEENRPTQILFADTALGQSKAESLSARMRMLGFEAEGHHTSVGWGWTRGKHIPAVALLGVDNMETRRATLSAGFDRLIIGGVGASFVEPRITWHDVPGDQRFAKLFPDAPPSLGNSIMIAPSLRETLEATPGRCGWLVFNQVAAAAPSMGLLAAVLVVCRLFEQPSINGMRGGALLWSQLLPHWSESINSG